MKKLTFLVIAVLLLCLCTAPALARNAENDYNKALSLLADEKYQDAQKQFASLGSYLDAPRYSMYCSAILSADSGLYAIAVENLESLGNFMDSPQLAVYYAALAFEQAEDYETAGQLLETISLYKDSASRILTYPEKINARDYQKALAAKEAGDLDAALSLFKKLGKYQDSEKLLTEVEELIRLRDEAAALAANEAAYKEAEECEAAGDFAKAYDLFVSLGDFKDAAARAKSVQQKAQYQNGMAAISSGSYEKAFTIFTDLADYEDAAEKAYALGISQFASMSRHTETAAAFRFHDQWGLINFTSNQVTAPQFESLSCLSENCFKVRNNGLYGLIDADGNQLAPCDWYDITALSDHTAVAASQHRDDSGWWTAYSYTFALLSEDGRKLTREYAAIGSNASSDISYPNLYAPKYFDGLMRVKTADGKWGFIDNTGAEKIAPLFQEASEFSNGLAAVKQGGKWGYIGTDGSFRIEPVFLAALDFNENGRAEVQSLSGWHVIDTNGELVYFTSQPMQTALPENESSSAAIEDQVQYLAERYAQQNGIITESGELYVDEELLYFMEEVLNECGGDVELAAVYLGI